MLYYITLTWNTRIMSVRRGGAILYREPDNTNHRIQNKTNF